MPRKRHPAHAVMMFFETQPKDICDLTLSIIRETLRLRFAPAKFPKPKPARKAPPKPEQLSLPFGVDPATVKTDKGA